MNAPGVSYALRANGEEFIFEASISKVEVAGIKTYTAILRDITERKQMEQALWESKAIFLQLTENISEVFWIGTPDWNEVLYISPAYEKIWGRSIESLYARPLDWLDAVVDADREQVIDAISRKSTGDLSDVTFPEYRILRPDGSERWIRARAFPVHDAEGKIYRVAGIAEDITERKQTEEKLQLTQFASDQAPDCIFWIDKQARICYVNEAVWRELGYTKEELLAMSIPDIDPDFPAAAWPAHWKELQQKDTLTFETRRRRKNGSIFPVDVSANFVKFGDKEFNVAFTRNITERKQVEKTLHEAKEKFQSLVESSSDWIWEVDANTVYTYASPKVKELLGYEPHEVIGRTPFDLMPLGEKIRVGKLFEEIARKQTPFSGLENSNLHKDGHLVVLETSGVPIFDKEGEFCGYRGIDRDITERKRAEEALRFERDRAQVYLDTVETIIVALNTEGRVTTINRKGCQLIGWEEEEIIGKKWFATYLPQPDGMEKVYPHFLEIISGEFGYAEYFENPVITRSGELRQIAWHNALLRDKQGRITGTLSAGEDITERKKSEVDLRIASAAFESQESLMITDADGVILRVNHAFTEATGYTAEEAVGQTPRLLKSGRHDVNFYREMWGTLQRTGKWQGEIWDRRKNGEIYPKSLTISTVKGDDGVVTHYVGADHDITKRKAAEEEINNLAFYDSLTQLPNRRLLNDRLGKTMVASKRSGRYGAVMFLDLDNFKPLNDTHGHSVGDLLLVEVARRIVHCVREVDTVARFGGDEFVVVLSELDEDKAESASQASIVAEKVRTTLNEPYVLKIQHEGEAETIVEHHCTSSIGVVLLVNHEASAEDILKWADMAMYQAKEAGRNQIRFYEPKA